MARVVVDVMLKPEILDPQGQAVQRALPRLGFDGIVDVRQGKRFEIELAGPADDAALARAREIAERLLANTVIEQFDVRFDIAADSASAASPASATTASVTAPSAPVTEQAAS
jgi:phosphoribosylformylglycinamidine synthase PurS subunit